MKKIILLSLIISGLLNGCTMSSKPSMVITDTRTSISNYMPSNTEQALYDTVIEYLKKDYGASGTVAVINDKTKVHDISIFNDNEAFRHEIRYLNKNSSINFNYTDVFTDFKKRNSNIYEFSKDCTFYSGNYRFNSYFLEQKNSSDELRKMNYWNSFYTIIPDAIGRYGFSIISFNSDRTYALLWVNFEKSPMMASGSYFLYKNEKEIFILQEKILITMR